MCYVAGVYTVQRSRRQESAGSRNGQVVWCGGGDFALAHEIATSLFRFAAFVYNTLAPARRILIQWRIHDFADRHRGPQRPSDSVARRTRANKPLSDGV